MTGGLGASLLPLGLLRWLSSNPPHFPLIHTLLGCLSGIATDYLIKARQRRVEAPLASIRGSLQGPAWCAEVTGCQGGQSQYLHLAVIAARRHPAGMDASLVSLLAVRYGTAAESRGGTTSKNPRLCTRRRLILWLLPFAIFELRRACERKGSRDMIRPFAGLQAT